jgi:4-hydroxybenzoate polyprenyltransferase
MQKTFLKIMNSLESAPTGFYLWISSFLAIIVMRILTENWIGGLRNRSGLFIFYEFTHTFLFFLIAYLIFLWMLNSFLKVGFRKISNILLWGYLLIITPPIIDFIISRGAGFWSFYKFDSLAGLFQRFLTFFGDKPEIGITYGVRSEVALALVFMFVYSLAKSKTFLKSLLIFFLAYFIFFILGTFPSWITIFIKGFTDGFLSVTEVDVAQMFLTPVLIFSRSIPDIVSSLNIKMSIIYALMLAGIMIVGLFFYQKNKFLSFVKNARYPQLLYHWGLVLTGMGMAAIFTRTAIEINFFNLLSFILLETAVCFAWLASVVPNDIADKSADEITPNKNRPLIRGILTLDEYKLTGWVLFSSSILFSAIVNFKIALFLLVYQAIAWIYSCWPLRLKRFAFISTFISSVASLLVLFSGFILVSPEQNIKDLPLSIVALLVISYTLSLPIKDLKDIKGDEQEGVYTVPVLFGENWGRIIIGSGIFISFVLSVLLLNEFRLFWWAFLSGGISFWLVNDKRINPPRLPWWIMGVVIIYVLILIKIIFVRA